MLGLFLGPMGLGSYPDSAQNPIGYPKYLQIIVYIRYIWVTSYTFGILYIFQVTGLNFRVKF